MASSLSLCSMKGKNQLRNEFSTGQPTCKLVTAEKTNENEADSGHGVLISETSK